MLAARRDAPLTLHHLGCLQRARLLGGCSGSDRDAATHQKSIKIPPPPPQVISLTELLFSSSLSAALPSFSAQTLSSCPLPRSSSCPLPRSSSGLNGDYVRGGAVLRGV